MSIAIIDMNVEAVRPGDAGRTPPRHGVDDVVHELRARLEGERRRRARRAGWTRRFVSTGLAPLDVALPQGGLPCGSITEILADAYGVGAMSLAMRIAAACSRPKPSHAPPLSSKGHVFGGSSTPGARSIVPPYQGGIEGGGMRLRNLPQPLLGKEGSWKNDFHQPSGEEHRNPCVEDHRSVVVIDTRGDFYPPAVLRYGIALDRIIIIRPKDAMEAFWATDQSLRCSGVAAVIAPLTELDELRSRRLQLAAESSGSIGLVIRTTRRRIKSFAAVRMLVESVGWHGCAPLAHGVPEEHGRAEAKALRHPCRLSMSFTGDVHPCRITLLKVREGTPVQPFVVDLHHETGTFPVHSVPVDRPVAKRA